MKQFMNITKALADESRVRLLFALKDNELCVCQLIEFLSLAPSTVSKHLSILSQADLVKSRKDGRWIYYKIPSNKDATKQIKTVLKWVFDSLSAENRIKEDKRRIEKVLKVKLEEICRRVKG